MLKAFALMSGLGFFTSSVLASEKVSAVTLDNLQAALNGESNAHARYLAFAKKADEEGYAGVASLFRAAARAEEIHANNHAAVIRKSGGAAEAKLETPVVKSTRENLEAAIKGETFERDQMYPDFIRQAQANPEALQTFEFALAAEAEHARLYSDALENLESMTSRRTFYVCPVCGFTARNPEVDSCPTCATSEELFEQVS